MAGTFDPYAEWLGIKHSVRPLTNYQLLGLTTFESQVETIEQHAQQQLDKLSGFRKGEHALQAKRLAFEVESAKTCLLNPTTKASYDAGLRASKSPVSGAKPTHPIDATRGKESVARPPTPPVPVKTPVADTSQPTFDPYRKWLGITPKDQPPNHYRLLGIDLFEADPEIIDMAGNRQTRYLQQYLEGKHTTIAKKLVSEVTAAKLCLLDANTKLAYDTSIKSRTQPKTETANSDDDIYALAPTSAPARQPEVPRPAVASGISKDEQVGQPKPFAGQAGNPSHSKPFAIKKSSDIWWKVLVGFVGIIGSVLLVMGSNWFWNSTTTFNRRPVSRKPSPSRQATVTAHSPDAAKMSAARPPKMARISDQIIDCGMKMQIGMKLDDPGTSADKVRFSLAAGAPFGAAIDPTTGIFTWIPSRNQAPKVYPITIMAQTAGPGALSDQKTFRITVRNVPRRPAPPVVASRSTASRKKLPKPRRMPSLSLPNTKVDSPISAVVNPAPGLGRNQQPLGGGNSSVGTSSFTIEFPSGTTITSAAIDTRAMVRRDIGMLLKKCRAKNLEAVGFYRAGSDSEIETLAALSKSKKLCGPVVIFHPCQGHDSRKPKQYVTYRNETWNGVLATWDEKGNRTFWGNYVSGQRHGLCCVFHDDKLAAVLECTWNNVDVVHLIIANQVSKTLTNADEALADETAGPMLNQIDEIEKDLKQDCYSLRARLKHEVQSLVGSINSKRRAAASARSAGRAAAQQQAIKKLKSAGGW